MHPHPHTWICTHTCTPPPPYTHTRTKLFTHIFKHASTNTAHIHAPVISTQYTMHKHHYLCPPIILLLLNSLLPGCLLTEEMSDVNTTDKYHIAWASMQLKHQIWLVFVWRKCLNGLTSMLHTFLIVEAVMRANGISEWQFLVPKDGCCNSTTLCKKYSYM